MQLYGYLVQDIVALILFSAISIWLVLGSSSFEMAILKINPVRVERWQKIAAFKNEEGIHWYNEGSGKARDNHIDKYTFFGTLANKS
jgi:hypothetical protein